MGKAAELKELIEIAKDAGIAALKVGDIEFRFHAAQPKPVKIPELKDAMPPDDELLYASTDYFDELQEQRKAKAPA